MRCDKSPKNLNLSTFSSAQKKFTDEELVEIRNELDEQLKDTDANLIINGKSLTVKFTFKTFCAKSLMTVSNVKTVHLDLT